MKKTENVERLDIIKHLFDDAKKRIERDFKRRQRLLYQLRKSLGGKKIIITMS